MLFSSLLRLLLSFPLVVIAGLCSCIRRVHGFGPALGFFLVLFLLYIFFAFWALRTPGLRQLLLSRK